MRRSAKWGSKGSKVSQGAELEDEAETLTIETIYGEKKVPYKDAMLERCHVCKGKDHMIFDEIIGESKETKDGDRFAEVERIEAMSPEEKVCLLPEGTEQMYPLQRLPECMSGLQLPQMCL